MVELVPINNSVFIFANSVIYENGESFIIWRGNRYKFTAPITDICDKIRGHRLRALVAYLFAYLMLICASIMMTLVVAEVFPRYFAIFTVSMLLAGVIPHTYIYSHATFEMGEIIALPQRRPGIISGAQIYMLIHRDIYKLIRSQLQS